MNASPFLSTSSKRVESALEERFAKIDCGAYKQCLLDAMRYSTLNGGKRIRAALVYATAESVVTTMTPSAIDDMACAIEMIHAYSLIHDDLPAMDNDQYRRGMLACHVKYGESIAILAGDTLQVHAFELLNSSHTIPPKQRLTIIGIVAKAIGITGMAGGQAMDMLARQENKPLSIAYLEETHRAKTGRLIQASVMIGASGSSDETYLEALENFSEQIGLGFQIKDDLLDWLAHTNGQSNDEQQKTSYPAVAGLAHANKRLRALHNTALHNLQSHPRTKYLQELANYMMIVRKQ